MGPSPLLGGRSSRAGTRRETSPVVLLAPGHRRTPARPIHPGDHGSSGTDLRRPTCKGVDEPSRCTCRRRLFAEMTVSTADHHSAYLARAVANLPPEGRERVDELLDELAAAGRGREWVVRFATAREAEVDAGRTDVSSAEEPGERLSKPELEV